MNGSEDARQHVWEWIKHNSPRDPKQWFPIRAQTVHGVSAEPSYIDALWQLAIAGVLRPDGDPQYVLTESGKEAVVQDISPYERNIFLQALRQSAPRLHPDSRAYIALALDCIYGIPAAAVALSRVALEIEIDSLIDHFLAAWQPSSTTKNKLLDRNLSVRVEELLRQLRDRQIQSADENKLFGANINLLRISGNQVLHPKGNVPTIDPLLVASVMQSFRSFASMASDLKV